MANEFVVQVIRAISSFGLLHISKEVFLGPTEGVLPDLWKQVRRYCKSLGDSLAYIGPGGIGIGVRMVGVVAARFGQTEGSVLVEVGAEVESAEHTGFIAYSHQIKIAVMPRGARVGQRLQSPVLMKLPPWMTWCSPSKHGVEKSS